LQPSDRSTTLFGSALASWNDSVVVLSTDGAKQQVAVFYSAKLEKLDGCCRTSLIPAPDYDGLITMNGDRALLQNRVVNFDRSQSRSWIPAGVIGGILPGVEAANPLQQIAIADNNLVFISTFSGSAAPKIYGFFEQNNVWVPKCAIDYGGVAVSGIFAVPNPSRRLSGAWLVAVTDDELRIYDVTNLSVVGSVGYNPKPDARIPKPPGMDHFGVCQKGNCAGFGRLDLTAALRFVALGGTGEYFTNFIFGYVCPAEKPPSACKLVANLELGKMVYTQSIDMLRGPAAIDSVDRFAIVTTMSTQAVSVLRWDSKNILSVDAPVQPPSNTTWSGYGQAVALVGSSFFVSDPNSANTGKVFVFDLVDQ